MIIPCHAMSGCFLGKIPPGLFEKVSRIYVHALCQELDFLEKNKKGGIHHICFEVEDIDSAIMRLTRDGATILGDGKAKIGAHGKPVIFLHPKDFNGTLIELEEVSK